MRGLFVLIIKDKGYTDETLIVWCIGQEHSNCENNMIVHASIDICQDTIRMIISIAAINDFELRSQDISQSYIQSRSNLSRDVYIRPKHGSNLNST